MADRQIYIDAESIYNLMVHYSEGQVPLSGEVLDVGVSSLLGRWIGFRVASHEWKAGLGKDGGLLPLHFRYEGKRVMSWEGGQELVTWGEPEHVEAPKRQ